MQPIDIVLIAVAFLVGLVATAAVRAYAERVRLMDIPNQRSSHEKVTPRGGGLSIVIVTLGVVVLHFVDLVYLDRVFLVLLGAGLMVAIVGFIDDHRPVPAVWRLLVHAAAAIVLVSAIGGMPAVQFGESTVDLGLFGDVVAVVFIVWFTNLFNFMDGIDGIASVETICIAVGLLLMPSVANSGAIAALLAALAAGTAGFLVWNWPPARIFMGDVGSSYLGFVLSAMALVALDRQVTSIWPWLILAGVFSVDATVTLVVRVARGDAWHSAHRSHAYQILARTAGSHAKVSLGVVVVNVIWLMPLAWVAHRFPAWGWWLTCLAWLPLVVFAIRVGAGRYN